MLTGNRSSVRARRTLMTGAVAALVCIGFSVLCLVLVGRSQTDMAQNRAISGWDRVLPIIKLGQLPALLPDRRDGKEQAIQVLVARDPVFSATRPLVGHP